MPIHPIVGLPDEYQVRGDREGKRFVLVYPDWDYLLKVANYGHLPSIDECLEAIKKYENRKNRA